MTKEVENTGGKLIIEFLPYGVIEKLLEWHFNIFSLPENKFINKANLK